MRRLTLIVVLALGLAACGGGSGSKDGVTIQLGVTGGLVVPYAVTIAPDGSVTTTGHPPVAPTALTSAQAEDLSRQVKDGIGKLKPTLQCGHTLPDEAAQFIKAVGKTVSVRGSCEPGFNKLWSALTTALQLNQ